MVVGPPWPGHTTMWSSRVYISFSMLRTKSGAWLPGGRFVPHSLEKHVSANHPTVVMANEGHMTRRMSRNPAHLELGLTTMDRLAGLQIENNLRKRIHGHPIHLCRNGSPGVGVLSKGCMRGNRPYVSLSHKQPMTWSKWPCVRITGKAAPQVGTELLECPCSSRLDMPGSTTVNWPSPWSTT